MKKKDILDTLSVVEKEHVQQAIDKLDKDGVPGNLGSYLYDVLDSETGNKYPPPYLIETAYKIASGKKLPKGFFDKIKNNGPHFEKIQSLGFQIEIKWYDDLDLSSKVFSYKWLYTLSSSQWNRVLDAGKMILDNLDVKKDDSKLVVSFRDDVKQRMGIIIGSKLVGGFYLEKGEIYLSFFVDENYDISADSRLSLSDFKFANNIGKLIYLKLDDWQGEKDLLNQQVLSDISNYYKDASGTSWKNSHLPFMTDVIRSQGPRRRFLSFMRQKPQERLMDVYKYYLKTTGNEDELYKWEVGKEFKENWDLKAKDFSAMLKSVKLANLISIQSNAFYREARKNPEEARTFFTYLFDESKTISDRLDWARDEGTELVKKWHPGWKSAGQDERTLSVLWGYNDLSKHALYKSSFYSKYCDLLEISTAKPGGKYEHYLTLIKDLVENYIKKDQELIALHNKTIDLEKHIEDPNYHLLAQNLLYRILDGYWTWDLEGEQEEKCNYWVFQGNPKLFDFETALRNEILTDWTVSAHKDKIKIGDKVVLWITGSDAGCYALAEVTSEPHTRTTSADDHLWKEEDNSELKADIKVTHNLVNNPILKTEIDSLAKLKNLKVGNQGTNFSASKEEYEKLLSMYSISEPKNYWVYSPGENAMYWDTFYEEGILGLGWNELGDISRFNDKDEIVKELQRIEETDSSKKNDATANWDFIHRVNVGDVIIAKKGRQELLGYGIVTSGYYYDPSRPDQHHLRKIEWKLKGSWPISDNLSLKTLTIITEYGCELPEFEFYYQRLLADMGVDVPRIKKEIMPINQILYGPPGTGKTYHLKTELFPRYTARESSVTKDDFVKEIVGDLSWWKVVALVLKEMKAGKVSDIREHKFLKVKESLSNSNTVKQTIWGQLQAHTVEECVAVNVKRKMTPLIFFKDENSNWRLDEQGYEQVEEEISSILEEINNFESKKDKEIKRYEFVTFHQSYAYEDFIEGIKPVMEEGSDGDIQYEIKDGLFKKLCQRAGNDPSNSYAIFIDEINRGNVSSIFGELITLIEDDKRLGSENAMTATLPYSRSIFGVPRNVHIYGTMNTADRSVEALDTALRRRFSFLEMLPDSSKLEVSVEGIRLSELLTILNDRIEVLVDRDHTIGHAFFINDKNLDDLRNTFANKVIPLLQEYFYGDYGKMEMVIGSAFFEVKDTTKIKFAVKPEDFDPEGKVYHIVDLADKKTMSDDDFKEALTKLIKGA